MEEKNKKDISRRDFIKIVGISAATSTGLLYGCSSKATQLQAVPREKERYLQIKLLTGHLRLPVTAFHF